MAGGEEEVEGEKNCTDMEVGGADGTHGQRRRAGRENIMERGKLNTKCFCDTEGGQAGGSWWPTNAYLSGLSEMWGSPGCAGRGGRGKELQMGCTVYLLE